MSQNVFTGERKYWSYQVLTPWKKADGEIRNFISKTRSSIICDNIKEMSESERQQLQLNWTASLHSTCIYGI